MSDIIYKIGITLLKDIGPISAKKLIEHCGGAHEVFHESRAALECIQGISDKMISAILNQNVLIRAEEEVKFIEDNEITPLFYQDKDYPFRLKQCDDAPILLYKKGNYDLNKPKVISVVGTRNATEYGQLMCENILQNLASLNPTIVSGLAYGIDIFAHRNAMKLNVPTIAVLAHGLDKIYPAVHKNDARKMLENGGLLTEFMSNTIPDRENFPKRNRIVAGLSDMTLVIESAARGGSLITAELANSYNRDVFAVPGKIGDIYSEGCNKLIKINKAHLVQSAEDIFYIMDWKSNTTKKKAVQIEIPLNFNPDEKCIVDLLFKKKEMSIDGISIDAKMPLSKTSSILLNLEFAGHVKSLPGKVYKLTL